MAVCKPQSTDVSVQIDPASFCGIQASDNGNAEDAAASEESKNGSIKFDQHFVCGICQMVVIDAEECGKCQNVFCSACIKQWQKISNNYKVADPPAHSVVSDHNERNLVVVCPMCKEGYQGAPLHRYLKNKLNSFLFKCQVCSEPKPMAYEKIIEHQLKSCQSVKVPCPLRCNMIQRHGAGDSPGPTLFSRGDELKNHLKEKCPNMSVTCARCDSEVAMGLR